MAKRVFSLSGLWAVITLGFGLLSFGEARAEEAAWRFVYEAPPSGCPTRSLVRAQVVAHLGFDAFPETADASSELRIAIRPDERGLVAIVERRDDGTLIGQRKVHASTDCTELAASAALAGSILIDPTGSMAKRQPARSEPAPPTEPTPAENPWPPPAEPAPFKAPPSEPLEGSLAVRALVSGGLAPAPSVGFSVDGALRRKHLELRLEARSDLPVSADPLPDGAGVATRLIVGSLAPCWASAWFHLCGVFTAGAMLARSENLSPSERDASFFGGVGLRPMVELRLGGSVRLIGSVEGLLPLRPLSVTVRKQEVWSSPVVAGSVGLGFEVTFL